MDKFLIGLFAWAFGLVCVAGAMAFSLFFTGLVTTLAQWWFRAVCAFFA